MTDWMRAELSDVAMIDRKVIEASAIDDGTIYVGLENIVRGGSFVGVRKIASGELSSSKFAFTPRHVLYGKLRPYLAKIARPAFTGVCSTDILPILPGPELDRDYLAHFLLRPESIDLASSRATGANLPRLSPRSLAQFKIPLPPLSEQQRIANILDKADTLRVKRRAALAQLDELAQSIFLEMFGARAVVGSAMSSVAGVASQIPGSIRTGPFGSQLLHGEFTDSGIAVLGIDNAVHNEFRWGDRRYISERKYQQLERYTVHPGDILITIMGTCGRCAIVPNDIPLAINTKHLCCITLNTSKCLPVFLHAYFLQHPIARRYLTRKAKGAIMSGLNMGIIKDLPVPLVPMRDQQEFARRVEAIEALKSQHRTALGQFDELFASLQQRAFRGEL